MVWHERPIGGKQSREVAEEPIQHVAELTGQAPAQLVKLRPAAIVQLLAVGNGHIFWRVVPSRGEEPAGSA